MSLSNDTMHTPPPSDVSVSLRRLVLIRWIAVLGQAVTVLVVHFGFDFKLPLTSTFVVIAARRCSISLRHGAACRARGWAIARRRPISPTTRCSSASCCS